jgi:tRNA(Ile)-lysidine synthase
LQVLALHVHHGLQPDADLWLRRVRAQARRWGALFEGHRLVGEPGAGESIEAWARRERYRALAKMAQTAGAALVLLAHHQRDQAETWLLQALRGGGPRGLSAMPGQVMRDGILWARPWLQQPRSAIEHYGQRHRLKPVEDASNADPRFLRSRLRQRVWPALLQAFPQAEQALAASCTQAQHATALARECAAADLPHCTEGDGLVVSAWARLPPARQRNALQAWLDGVLAVGVPASLVERLLASLAAAGPRSAWRVPAPGGELRLFRGVLVHARLSTVDRSRPEPPAVPASSQIRNHPLRSPLARSAPSPVLGHAEATTAKVPARGLKLSVPGRYALPGWPGGVLLVQHCNERGLAPERLDGVQCQARAGGERFQRVLGGVPRRLKLQYQAAGVPAWGREGPLLLDEAGTLLFVPGLGVDARCWAEPGRCQLSLQWLPA